MDQVYTIKAITGTVFVVGVAGQVRIARVGNKVLRGETVLTGGRGRVELVADDNTPLNLGPQGQLKIDEQLFVATRPEAAQAAVGSAAIERVIEALADNADLTETLEAPAAGAGAGAAGDGSSFVRLLRIVEGVDPLAFDFNTALSDLPPGVEPDAVAQVEDEPVPPPVEPPVVVPPPDVPDLPPPPLVAPPPPVVVPEEVPPPPPLPPLPPALVTPASVDEAGLPPGLDPDSNRETATGTLSLPAGWTAVPSSGNTPWGTFVINADGSYSYTLTQATVDLPGAAETDTVSYQMIDALGRTVTNTLVVTIVDDVPLAVDDATDTAEDTPVTVSVLANDASGADGGRALVSAVLVDPTHGSITIDAATGAITFTPAPGFEGVATIDYVMTDSDGDTDTAQLVVTVATDSVPAVSWVLVGPGVVDEGALPDGNLGGSSTTSGTLAIATGGDTVASVVITGVGGAVDVTAGGTVPGTYGDLVVTVDAGVYTWTYTLNGNAPHTDPAAVGSADPFPEDGFVVALTDSDGDSTPPADLVIQINDDGPRISASASGTGPIVTVDETAMGEAHSASYATLFSNDPRPGADGAGSVNSVYTLTVPTPGTDSGLTDAATGEAVLLRAAAGEVQGYIASSGAVVFTVTVYADGTVTLTQQRPLSHSDSTDPDDVLSLDAGLITLTRTDTLTDGDGDTSESSASVEVGAQLAFRDDAPAGFSSIGWMRNDDSLVVDETTLGSTATARVVSFLVLPPGFGGDGPGTFTHSYALGVSSPGALAGLADTVTGEPVLVRMNGGVLEAYTATSNALVFTLTVDLSTAALSLTPYRAVVHPDAGNPDDLLTLTDSAVTLSFTETVTDADGDSLTESFTTAIGAKLGFHDDGPRAVDDAANTPEDTAVTVNVIANDPAGADGGRALVSGTLATAGAGSIGVNAATGEITFTPAPGFAGTATVNYVMRDAEGDTDAGQWVITVAPDSFPSVTWLLVGPGGVDEGALPDGNLGGSTTTSGTLLIATGGDTVGSVKIDGMDVTAGGTVPGTYGDLVVTVGGGVYSWTYTLNDNAPHTNTTAVGGADPFPEDSFSVVLTDSDGDTTPAAPLVIQINDDGPLALDDRVNTAEDTAVTVNVLANDPAGADRGKALVSGTLATAGAGSIGVNAATGEITFTPAPGFAGTATVDYVMRDAEGDTAAAQMVVTVAPDSTPTVSWVQVGAGVVDEGGLPDGNLGGSTTTSGTLLIATGGDTVGSVAINGVDVTAGGAVPGTYGELVVTLSGGVYSWTYTLSDNAPHTNPAAVGGADPLAAESFSVVLTDSDGDATPAAPLVIQINDDGPVDVAPVDTAMANAVGASSGDVFLDVDGAVTDNYGADSAGTVVFAPSLDGAAATNSLTGGALLSSGLPITYSLSADGSVLTAATALGTVFTVTLDAANSSYEVQMLATVDGGAPAIDFNGGAYNFQGGNVSWAGFNTLAIDNSQDILLTPMVGGVSGGTLNTNANAGGISGGASVGAGEAMRVDFVVDLSGTPVNGGDFATPANQTQNFDGHYTVNGATAVYGVNGGAGSTTSVTIRAFDDADAVPIKQVGDGTPDTIVAVSITEGAAQQLVLASGGSSQSVTVGGTVYTASFDVTGAVTVSGITSGTALGVYTADGYNALTYAYAGGNTFKIGDFGTTALTPGEPVDVSLAVVVEDGDGDTATGQIDIQLEPLNIGGAGSRNADGFMALAEAPVAPLLLLDGEDTTLDLLLAEDTPPLLWLDASDTETVDAQTLALDPADLRDEPVDELPLPDAEEVPAEAETETDSAHATAEPLAPELAALALEVPGADHHAAARLMDAHTQRLD